MHVFYIFKYRSHEASKDISCMKSLIQNFRVIKLPLSAVSIRIFSNGIFASTYDTQAYSLAAMAVLLQNFGKVYIVNTIAVG